MAQQLTTTLTKDEMVSKIQETIHAARAERSNEGTKYHEVATLVKTYWQQSPENIKLAAEKILLDLATEWSNLTPSEYKGVVDIEMRFVAKELVKTLPESSKAYWSVAYHFDGNVNREITDAFQVGIDYWKDKEKEIDALRQAGSARQQEMPEAAADMDAFRKLIFRPKEMTHDEIMEEFQKFDINQHVNNQHILARVIRHIDHFGKEAAKYVIEHTDPSKLGTFNPLDWLAKYPAKLDQELRDLLKAKFAPAQDAADVELLQITDTFANADDA